MPATGEAKKAIQKRYRARLRGEICPVRVRPWSESELSELRDAYASNGGKKSRWLREFSAKIGRHVSNVCRKARQLGLGTDRNRDNGGPKPRPRKFFDRIGRWSRPGQRHPRGMLGKHHSPEVRARMSAARVGVPRAPFSQETCMRISMAMVRRMSERPDSINPGKRGRGGRRPDLGNVYFRSSYEANYARYLNWRKIPWKYETKTFRFEGISRGTMTYTPDFFLPESGEYHEVKGWMDPKSKTKLARMDKYFPEVKVVVIGADWFKACERQGTCSIVPNWECRHTKARKAMEEKVAARKGGAIGVEVTLTEVEPPESEKQRILDETLDCIAISGMHPLGEDAL